MTRFSLAGLSTSPSFLAAEGSVEGQTTKDVRRNPDQVSPSRAVARPDARQSVTVRLGPLFDLHSAEAAMCRNIKMLFNFEPPATDAEVRDASLQFVRKLSGFTAPSRANEAAFARAVEAVTAAARELIDSLETTAEPRSREVEAAKAKARSAARFGTRD